ncbi:alkaline phosphatase family protein [Candidatus Desantisbacteria bacterium]|nr:alkaline phosphatase family protein [Candidatus Desantisbacteria bacterium]
MKKHVSIYILIDALGWNYIKARPFLDNIAKTRQKVKSVFGYSSGVIPSIVTGKYPFLHKHWSLFFYSPLNSPFRWQKKFSFIPNRWFNTRAGRKIVEEISKKLMGYKGYFETYLIPVEYLSLFDISEKKNIYKPGGIREGKSIFDVWAENKINYSCLSYPMQDNEIWAEALKNIEKKETGVYFIYLADLDAFLHRYCKDSQMVNEKISWYEKEILKLYNKACEFFSNVDLYVFSDHGMAPVYKSYDLKSEINDLKLKIPEDYVVIYDSTMARFWFFKSSAKEKILELLKTKSYGRILSEKEKKDFGINFENNQYGEVIFLMETGSVINPSFMGSTAPSGMHGFDINDETMDAAFISNTNINSNPVDVKDFFKIMSP